MAAEQFVNDLGAGTTLYTSLTDNSGTTVVVVNYTGIPTVPQFRIRIDTEIMLVTAISIGASNSTLTVVRGAELSTAATHSSGASVYHVLTAASIQAPGFQYAAFPASTTGYLVPVLTNFSTSGTVGTSTATQLANSVTLTDAATASTHLRRYKATAYSPGSSATAIAYFQNNCVLEAYHLHGLYVSDGTKLITYAVVMTGTTNIKADVLKWATETTATGTSYLSTVPILTSPDYWLKLVDGGTGNSLTFSVSRDGLNWVQVHTISRTDYLTPSELGIVWESNNATHAASISWLSWSLT